jgi:hypothetical protein
MGTWRETLIGCVAAMAVCGAGCGGSGQTAPTPSNPQQATSAFRTTFGENPVPFRASGCNASVPQGWYTTVQLQETSGVAFRPNALVQKLDGNASSFLDESFNSRFGACGGGTFEAGVIPANGTVCASVGVCTASAFSSYQFQISGTDANGHTITYDSPVLQLGPR